MRFSYALILSLVSFGSVRVFAQNASSTPASHPSRPAPDGRLSLPELIKATSHAVVTLRTFDAGGAQLGLGSGFLVDKGRVVTNAHVVESAARIEIYDFEDNILGTTDFAESLSTGVDLAVLPAMPRPPGLLPIAEYEPAVGEFVVVIGAPQGLSNTVSTGIVSAFRDHEGKRWMQISAPISQGSSGGPVMNSDGKVIGVSVAVLREGQNLNFAVPAKALRALLGSPPGHVALRGSKPTEPSKVAPIGTASSEKRIARSTLREILSKEPKILPGQVFSGELTPSDAAKEGGSRVDGYEFQVRRAGTYTVFVASQSFDANVGAFVLRGDDDAVSLGFDDDSAGSTNSRLVFRVDSSVTVGLIVSSAQAGEVGAYKIGLFEGEVTLPEKQAPAKNDRWVLVAETDESSIRLDRTTVRRLAKGYVQAWSWTSYTVWQDVDGARYNNTKSFLDIDCRGRRLRRQTTTYFSEGSVVLNSDAAGSWMPWTPDSTGEAFGEAACKESSP